jgi:hypothetical protein
LPGLRPLTAMFGAKAGNLHRGGRAAELELEFEWLRLKQRRHGEPPTIEMLIGDWYVDALGIRTREITARLAVRCR